MQAATFNVIISEKVGPLSCSALLMLYFCNGLMLKLCAADCLHCDYSLPLLSS